MLDKKQCVYEHWRPDLNVCFYVGRGPSSRANDLNPKNRNAHHGRVVAKMNALGLGVEVRIYAGGLTVVEANALEVSRIAHYRAIGHPLTNQTDGGEGLCNPSVETRAKMAARQIGKKHSGERCAKIGRAHRGRTLSPEHIAKLSLAQKGVKRPHARKAPPEVYAASGARVLAWRSTAEGKEIFREACRQREARKREARITT